jgi:hypothetical protein
LVVYAVGVVLYLWWQATEEARGRAEFSETTVIMAILWPAWVAFIVVVILWVMAGSALRRVWP